MSSAVRGGPRSDERLSVEGFVRWLHAEHPLGRVSDPTPGSEPPDFWLSINGCRYAVEVTQVVHSIPTASADGLSTPDPRRTDSERAVDASVERFLDRVRQGLARDGLPRGVYVVDAGPAILDIMVRSGDSKERKDVVKKRRSELAQQIAAYVRHTADVNKAPHKVLPARDEGDDPDIDECCMGIEKVGTWTDILDCCRSETYRSAQVVADISEAVVERARTKAGKLKGLETPAILLLLVTDLRAEPKHLDGVVASLQEGASLHEFEAAFLISRCGDECRRLHCAPSFLSLLERGNA